MSSSGTPFTTITFENGAVAVVRSDPREPRFLEVIAIFYDASHARSYAEIQNNRSAEESIGSTEAHKKHVVELTEIITELSPRQIAVLGALRASMDENKQVAAKAATLAEAAHIPLGSLHSVLQSLEKKQLIKTARAGSARAPAVYQIL
jgi:DNA-binding MarR family transcriptional regulator